jgi:hypothetical protein
MIYGHSSCDSFSKSFWTVQSEKINGGSVDNPDNGR